MFITVLGEINGSFTCAIRIKFNSLGHLNIIASPFPGRREIQKLHHSLCGWWDRSFFEIYGTLFLGNYPL